MLLFLVNAEPRGGSQEEDFDSVLKGYYDSISQRNVPAIGKKRRIKKSDLKKGAESTENFKKEGAAFLAVCRGKVHNFYSKSVNIRRTRMLL